jgi:hypothetical protein
MMMMMFAGVALTQETIQQTRQWFADNSLACIAEAVSGDVRVNDLPSYIAWRNEQHAEALAGKHDHTFTFLQRAHTLQTGECIAMLP